MQRILPLCLAALTLSTLAAAQNLVVNGDFEAPTIAPWVASQSARLEPFDTNGSVVSQALAITPDFIGTNRITQDVAVTPGGIYELRADIAWATRPLAIGILNINFWIIHGGFVTRIASIPASLSSPIQKLSEVFIFQARGSTVRIDLELTSTSINTADQVRGYLDNVSIRPVRPLTARLSSQHAVGLVAGEPMNSVFYGSPNNADFLFASPGGPSGRMKIPGISGDLGIDPSSAVLFVSSMLNSFGLADVVKDLPVAPSLIGTPIYWQGVQVDLATGAADFSWEFMQSIGGQPGGCVCPEVGASVSGSG